MDGDVDARILENLNVLIVDHDAHQGACPTASTMAGDGDMKIVFVPAGNRWIWKVAGSDGRLVQFSGQRFASLNDALGDARKTLLRQPGREERPDGPAPVVA